MVMALKPILDEAGIKRVVVSAYQAVSGAWFCGNGRNFAGRQKTMLMGPELEARIIAK